MNTELKNDLFSFYDVTNYIKKIFESNFFNIFLLIFFNSFLFIIPNIIFVLYNKNSFIKYIILGIIFSFSNFNYIFIMYILKNQLGFFKTNLKSFKEYFYKIKKDFYIFSFLYFLLIMFFTILTYFLCINLIETIQNFSIVIFIILVLYLPITIFLSYIFINFIFTYQSICFEDNSFLKAMNKSENLIFGFKIKTSIKIFFIATIYIIFLISINMLPKNLFVIFLTSFLSSLFLIIFYFFISIIYLNLYYLKNFTIKNNIEDEFYYVPDICEENSINFDSKKIINIMYYKKNKFKFDKK